MNKTLALVLLLPALLLPICTMVQAETRPFPPHTVANSEIRDLPRAANGRDYQLHILLPGSYATDSARKYPVLYLTDPYWDFNAIAGAYGNLVYDKVVPEFIVVGMGYAGKGQDYNLLRRWDLSPVVLDPTMPHESGHATEFLTYVQRELIPFVEREYRVDTSYRAVAGSSLGGLFALYAMYTEPTLFQGYIAISPATIDGNEWLFGYAQKFADTGAPIRARLFMTAAENEYRGLLDGIKRFDKKISAHRYPGLTYQFRLIDGERHTGTKPEGFVRGLRYVFAPLAPESGPSK